MAFAVGTRTSTSCGQRCLRLQPTQTIQVTSARERLILTNEKQHQYHCCAVTFLYFLHVCIFVQLLMALSFTKSEVLYMSHPTLDYLFSRQVMLLWYSAYHSFSSKRSYVIVLLLRFHPHVTVLPGDEVKVECDFDTTDRENFTYFGNLTINLKRQDWSNVFRCNLQRLRS